MINFSSVLLPFSVSDLISSGNGLLALIGGFILLGLSFHFVPPIIGIIAGNFRHNKMYADVEKYKVPWYDGIEDHIKEKFRR